MIFLGLPFSLFFDISSLHIYFFISNISSSFIIFYNKIFDISLSNNIFLNGYIFLNVFVIVTSDILNIYDNLFFDKFFLFTIQYKYKADDAIDIDWWSDAKSNLFILSSISLILSKSSSVIFANFIFISLCNLYNVSYNSFSLLSSFTSFISW